MCGDFLPYVVGNGKIYVGNNVKIFGKLDVIFGAIYEDIPEIYIGDNVTISHNVTFDVSSKLVIGANTLIAEGVTLQDCGGHQVDPGLRAQGVPPDKSDVRPITIGENVWLCSSAYLLPGVKVGDNSIIGVGVVLRGNVPSGALIYTPPPKVMKYRSLTAFNKE